MDQATHLRRMVRGVPRRIYRIGKEADGGSFSGKNGPRVLAITSGKGGVGKTNVVGNLAVACQRRGKRVLIFDADLGLANIDIIFGINPRSSIEDVIKGEKELSEVIVEGPEGVSVIPASSGVEKMAHLTEGQKINLLNEFDLLNRDFDILLVDTGAGISQNVIYFNLAAQERIVVVTPEPTSITDAYALMKIMFFRYGTTDFFLLLNMVRGETEARSVYEHMSRVVSRFMRGVSLEYAGFIPSDPLLRQAVGRRQPVVCCFPDTASSSRFDMLAEYLLDGVKSGPPDGNIKFFCKRLVTGATDWDNEGTDQ